MTESLIEFIDRIEKKIANWEEEFYFLKDKLRSYDKKPYKCPICEGTGYYHNVEATIAYGGKCPSCGGNRIVWG
jgi:rubrerythrin